MMSELEEETTIMPIEHFPEQLQAALNEAIACAALLELKCRVVREATIETLSNEALTKLAKGAF